jgi:hypothetical protein
LTKQRKVSDRQKINAFIVTRKNIIQEIADKEKTRNQIVFKLSKNMNRSKRRKIEKNLIS